MKTTFTECHIDYFDSEENRWCIDTWSTTDENEDGEVVGWIDGTSGNIYYRNPYAEKCPMIQELAAAKQKEVREEQKRKRGCMGENIAMLTSQVWNRVYPYMREPDCTQLAAEIRDAAYEFEQEWNDTPEEKRDGYYIDMIDAFANRLTAKLRDLLCDVPTPCSNIRVIKAVANEIENMMYNDINEGNGIEGFEGWCADGEVFEESGLDVEECMQLVREVAPIVDELVYKHLNVDQVEIDKTRKIYAIEDAARFNKFTDEIDEIDMLSYTEQDESGAERIVEDRFDYIDTTTIPISVHFICGTGYPDRNINLCRLTEESINTLYNCIDK